MPADRRLLLRFLIGAGQLGRARLLEVLRASAPVDVEPPRAAWWHPLLGALVEAPALLAAARITARRAYVRGPGRVVDPMWQRVRPTRAGQRIEARIDALRARVAARRRALEAIGRAEAAAASGLAESALGHLYTGTFVRLAGSPELAHLIHEESAGLTRGMVNELRDLSARADTRAERLVRRLRRRA